MSSNLRAIVILVLVFIAGGAAGVALERARTTPRRESRVKEGVVEDERIPTPLTALGLSDDETRELHAIARRWRPKASQLVRGLAASVGSLENDMFAEMLCVLSPDQRERYLSQLQQNTADTTLINRRFQLVRANQCPDSVGGNATPR
ncbi:MAG TPA: hypothetical protein VN706_01285 [Gemmatimonadaceae bacterium]|nr:hypothetical protein [Gemmatimonadaceae bacterium]